MKKAAIVAGTGFEGRASVIRKHCHVGTEVVLEREPDNMNDSNAIAVYLKVPKFGGLFGTGLTKIGYIKKGTAKSLAKAMDAGTNITGHVESFYAPPGRDYPRVTLEITDEK